MRFLKNKGTDTKWIIYIIAATILLPIIISFFCWIADFAPQILFFKIGSNSDWIAFWGSVSGSILGVFGTYKVLRIQLDNDKKKYEETQIDNTIFNMIALFQKVQENIKPGISKKLLGRITLAKRTLKDKLIKDGQKNLFVREKFLEIQSAVKILCEEEKVGLEARDNLIYINNDDDLERTDLSEQLFLIGFGNIFHKKLIDKNSLSEEGSANYEFLEKIYMKYSLIEEEYKDYTFNEAETFAIVDTVFSSYHSELGSFLLTFHRIVKYIMESKISMQKKKEYLGMVRALLTSHEMLVIFYNCFYTARGLGLKNLLSSVDSDGRKTGFFADELDLENFNLSGNNKEVDLPFFKYRELSFGKADLNKIASLTNIKKHF